MIKKRLKGRNKIYRRGNKETKCGVETEGKATQRLYHLEIHLVYSHQDSKLLSMRRKSLLNRVWLSPERLFQNLTNTEVDTHSQPLD